MEKGTIVNVFEPTPNGGLTCGNAINAATRQSGKTWTGYYVGPVTFEPSMSMVRPHGATNARRVFTEYLTIA